MPPRFFFFSDVHVYNCLLLVLEGTGEAYNIFPISLDENGDGLVVLDIAKCTRARRESFPRSCLASILCLFTFLLYLLSSCITVGLNFSLIRE
ncbi:hypothetical protein P175DRAFT_0246274 [Aspergillus ochraceoroseus IBT 24754]|uniref:Uncharacterized protein n=1 Tax=Aspergillus ochraceoroseus IBT 24754 TaxID=1392256 RepID=A0A2T5LXU0_9EURO|nr:uncharacterized protein P175DRAFT_0246274 [Aspergillus ochraceoroseus IBT 24754]PTU21102.1 hypothetical protein P175DRAFT_0246274 [Aspergillus ochraceoroseus IBT 24754]